MAIPSGQICGLLSEAPEASSAGPATGSDAVFADLGPCADSLLLVNYTVRLSYSCTFVTTNMADLNFTSLHARHAAQVCA